MVIITTICLIIITVMILINILVLELPLLLCFWWCQASSSSSHPLKKFTTWCSSRLLYRAKPFSELPKIDLEVKFCFCVEYKVKLKRKSMIFDEEAEKDKTWTIWERLWWCRVGRWSRCRRSWEKPTLCIVHTWKSSDINIYCISHRWNKYFLFKLAFSGLMQSIIAIFLNATLFSLLVLVLFDISYICITNWDSYWSL